MLRTIIAMMLLLLQGAAFGQDDCTLPGPFRTLLNGDVLATEQTNGSLGGGRVLFRVRAGQPAILTVDWCDQANTQDGIVDVLTRGYWLGPYSFDPLLLDEPTIGPPIEPNPFEVERLPLESNGQSRDMITLDTTAIPAGRHSLVFTSRQRSSLETNSVDGNWDFVLITVVPEPNAWSLGVPGGCLFGLCRRRRPRFSLPTMS